MSTPTSPAPAVTRLSPDDWRQWRELRLRCLRQDPDAFGSALEREQAFAETDWRERLTTSYAVLARVGDEPAGLGGLVEDRVAHHGDRAAGPQDVTWVVAMWTAPEHRGLGVGATVLQHLVAVHRSGAVTAGELRLWVSDGNPARRLYERAGFVATGTRAPIRPGATSMKEEMRLPARAEPLRTG